MRVWSGAVLAMAVAASMVGVSGTARADGVTGLALTGIPGQGTWETTLHPRDLDHNGVTDALYDSDLNITWRLRQDSEVVGWDWDGAKRWADDLVFGGYSDWRLPLVVDTGPPGCDGFNLDFTGTDCGYNVQTKIGGKVYSEMANLYYNTYGNNGAYDVAGNNVMQDWQIYASPVVFWLGLENAQDTTQAYIFGGNSGVQGPDRKDNLGNHPYLALAVRSGDVAFGVPEASTWAMVLVGLGMTGLASRGRKRERS